MIALAKAKPGALNYGSPGNGTPPHLAAELFKRTAGIEVTHVPFKGGGAMMQAMLGGHVACSFEGLTAQLPHVRAGSLRAIAVTGPQRRTVAARRADHRRSGLAGYEFSGWTGSRPPLPRRVRSSSACTGRS